MAVTPVSEGGDALERVRRENQTLYAVIKTVSSSLALDRVLGGIVDIATDATACHACFVYFLEDGRLVLSAASPQYAHLVGELGWGLDEGLTGWVARTKTPEFISENALQDPRMRYVPELEEERFQSMIAVPVLDRAGDVIGVIVLHTQAPREFDDDVLNFLVHTASLVAGRHRERQAVRRRPPSRRRSHHAHGAEPVARLGGPARGSLRRGHARRSSAAGGGLVPDLAPRAGGPRARARRHRPSERSRIEPRRVPHRSDARPPAPQGNRPRRGGGRGGGGRAAARGAAAGRRGAARGAVHARPRPLLRRG